MRTQSTKKTPNDQTEIIKKTPMNRRNRENANVFLYKGNLEFGGQKVELLRLLLGASKLILHSPKAVLPLLQGVHLIAQLARQTGFLGQMKIL